MHRFSRYEEKGYGLLMAGFGLIVSVHAAKAMFPLDLGDGPLFLKIFIILFLSCWYGLLLCFILYGLRSLHTIEIDDQEIRVCLGRLVLRRIPLEQVKTVGISAQYARTGITYLELVLSRYAPDELEERGQRYLKKRRVRHWMTRAGISSQGYWPAARACLFDSSKAVTLRMERTTEAESILRLHLHSAAFLTDLT